MEPFPNFLRSAPISPAQLRFAQFSSLAASSAHVALLRTAQVSSAQHNSGRPTTGKFSSGQVRLAQVSLAPESSPLIRSARVSSVKIAKLRSAPVRSAQLRPPGQGSSGGLVQAKSAPADPMVCSGRLSSGQQHSEPLRSGKSGQLGSDELCLDKPRTW